MVTVIIIGGADLADMATARPMFEIVHGSSWLTLSPGLPSVCLKPQHKLGRSADERTAWFLDATEAMHVTGSYVYCTTAAQRLHIDMCSFYLVNDLACLLWKRTCHWGWVRMLTSLPIWRDRSLCKLHCIAMSVSADISFGSFATLGIEYNRPVQPGSSKLRTVLFCTTLG